MLHYENLLIALNVMNNKYTFSGHESFPCKTLWLKKGYDFVLEKNDFNNPEAVIKLGVGKNMVSSIRFWLKAFGLFESDKITWLGDYLFDNVNGKDKYLEDIATLWLLHFNLVHLEQATIYNWFFVAFQRERKQFEREQILSYVRRRLAEFGQLNIFNANTVKKDLGVLLQNYSLPRTINSNEDFSTLFLDLDLIRYNDERKEYLFNIEGKRHVTPEIFFYGLLCLKGEDNTIPYEILQKLGLIFCMTDMETIDMLKLLSDKYKDYVTYSDIAGIKQIQFSKEIELKQVLDEYYGANI